ncbi:MAG: RagB/SusD family nutrient uptake outer membrane protein [Spirosomataceae bacterium]
MKKYFIYITAALVLGTTACNNDYLNPSTASEQQVVTDQAGLIAMVNGLQQKFSISRASAMYAYISANGLTTKELVNLNVGNTDEQNLQSGTTAVQGNNSVVTNLWNQSHLVKANADLVIKNIDNAKDATVKSGILAYAHFYRALALGTLAQFFEQAPIAVGTNATFSPRADVLKEAVASLTAAAKALNDNPPSAKFTGSVVMPLASAKNGIGALLARYNLMLGNYDAAIAAANTVDLTVKAGFAFDDLSRNPLFETSFSNRNVTESTPDFGLPTALIPDKADGRRAFYYNTTAGLNAARASFFTANGSVIPVYLPGEMLLIKAECSARKGALDDAITELNKVLTKKNDVWGVNAGLAAYAGDKTANAVLDEIYRQRCIELFLSGLRLEDSRRFNRPQAERTRNYYPYPLTERNNNTSTPADPAS